MHVECLDVVMRPDGRGAWLTPSGMEELEGQEGEEELKQSHELTVSKNGLGSVSINLLEQLRIEKCGKPACQDISYVALKLRDIERNVDRGSLSPLLLSSNDYGECAKQAISF